MKNNNKLAYVSSLEINKIIDDVWKDIHIDQPNITSKTTPDAYVMGDNQVLENQRLQIN